MPGLDHGVLREVGVFIAERLDAFTPASGKPQALVHVDAHFGNIMWDDRNEAGGGREGRISALLDFAGARLPEPPEAALMDRVLQRVPREMLRGVERIVMLPSRGTARYGGYLNGIIRLGADASWRRTRDAEFGGNYSLFTTTLLHEVGHAVYQRWLTEEQRRRVADLSLNWFIRRRPLGVPEPTSSGAEHFFVALLCAALLRAETDWGTTQEARELLDALGVRID